MILSILLLLQAASAATPPARPGSCAALPGPMTDASSPTVAASASNAAALPLGPAVQATLLPAAAVSLAVPVAKPAAAGSSAGLFSFAVATAGRYRVSLGAGAWIDVVAAGKAIPSVAHGHGSPCSGVRKMVDFDLTPGGYRLQLVGSATPTIAISIAKLP